MGKVTIHSVMRLAVSFMLCLMPIAVQGERGTAMPRNVQFSNLNTDAGFSSEFVHDVEQDQLGFMWFATQSGLNRYDGFKVRVFEHLPNDPNSISHSFVWDLYTAKDGKLWIGTERGVNVFSYAEGTFQREPFQGLQLSNYRVRQIIQDQRGNVWLGTLGDGLLKVNYQTQQLTQYKFDSEDEFSLPNNHVMALVLNQRGELWVGTDGGGIARFDVGQERFIRYQAATDDTNALSDNRIRRIFEDERGRLWIGTAGGGLNLFDPNSSQFVHYKNDPEDPLSLPAGQVSGVFEDSFGTLWIGTESGLAEWRPAIDGFISYKHDLTNANSLVNNRVNAITQDASGVLWIGTHNGVSRWNFLSDTFTYYQAKDGYLSSDLVTDVAETADGNFWVATYGGGLSRVNPFTGDVKHYRYDETRADSLPDDRVMVVFVDSANRVWVGTRGAGLARLIDEERFQIFTEDPTNPFAVSDNAITSILEDRGGGLWVGTFGGGLNYAASLDNPEFIQYRNDVNNKNSLSGDRVLKVYQDRAGEIWVGTEGDGLNRFVEATGKFTRYNLDAQGSAERPRGTPWEIFETPDRHLWLGTLGQGLLRWTGADRDVGHIRFEQFAAEDGLASDIFAIVPGDLGQLWLSSNRGLFEFDPEAREVRKFDRNTGLQGNEFSQGASMRSRSGRVMFGSNSGLVGFYPGDVPSNERVPIVAIEASSRTDALVRTWTGGDVPEVRLDYFDAFVAFDFIALDFVSPDKNEYRYRLVGFDTEWNVAKDYRQAIYSSLPPGSYSFQVEASNNDGVWNRHKSEIAVVVVPPPWSSWWAYVIYCLLLVMLAGLIYNNQRVKREAEIARRVHLERVVSERTAELAERNHELVTLNDKLEHASVTDALTGLRNRRFVDEHMTAEMSSLRRKLFASEPGTELDEMLFLMMIDLDGFKAVNDEFGHQAGDMALLGVKERLLAVCRKSDVVVRWGGDEFLIIGHAATLTGMEQFTEKIRLCLGATPYEVGHGNEGKLSASIGVAPIPFIENELNFASWEQICRVADAAAYLAKDSGKDAWVSISGTPGCRLENLSDLRENLGELLEQRKLRLRSSKPLTQVLA